MSFSKTFQICTRYEYFTVIDIFINIFEQKKRSKVCKSSEVVGFHLIILVQFDKINNKIIINERRCRRGNSGQTQTPPELRSVWLESDQSISSHVSRNRHRHLTQHLSRGRIFRFPHLMFKNTLVFSTNKMN